VKGDQKIGVKRKIKAAEKEEEKKAKVDKPSLEEIKVNRDNGKPIKTHPKGSNSPPIDIAELDKKIKKSIL
jgi:hypothetical protein